MAELLRYQPNSPPWTTDKSGMLKTCSPDWWVSGLFAGQIWYPYEYSKSEILKKFAEEYSFTIAPHTTLDLS